MLHRSGIKIQRQILGIPTAGRVSVPFITRGLSSILLLEVCTYSSNPFRHGVVRTFDLGQIQNCSPVGPWPLLNFVEGISCGLIGVVDLQAVRNWEC